MQHSCMIMQDKRAELAVLSTAQTLLSSTRSFDPRYKWKVVLGSQGRAKSPQRLRHGKFWIMWLLWIMGVVVHGVVKVWRYGGMEVWRHGGTEAWWRWWRSKDIMGYRWHSSINFRAWRTLLWIMPSTLPLVDIEYGICHYHFHSTVCRRG